MPFFHTSIPSPQVQACSNPSVGNLIDLGEDNRAQSRHPEVNNVQNKLLNLGKYYISFVLNDFCVRKTKMIKCYAVANVECCKSPCSWVGKCKLFLVHRENI